MLYINVTMRTSMQCCFVGHFVGKKKLRHSSHWVALISIQGSSGSSRIMDNGHVASALHGVPVYLSAYAATKYAAC